MPLSEISTSDKWVTDDQGKIIGVDSGMSGGAQYFAVINQGEAPVTATTNPVTGEIIALNNYSGVSRANTLTLMGDSLARNNWSVSDSTYKNINPYPFAFANALGRNRFKVIQNIAVAGVSTPSMVANQLPLLAANPTKYVYFIGGTNDLFVDGVAGDVVAARVIDLLESIVDLGCIPIWSTIWARTGSAAYYDDCMWCNDILRSYARTNKVGIFYDGYYLTQNPGDATLNPRTGWKVDNSVHPSSLEGYWLGKFINKHVEAAGVPNADGFASGIENITYGTNNKSNLLTNPTFAGTGGTVSANCAGTMPDNWTILWTTRAGTGVATAAIVDVADPVTGLSDAVKGIQVNISAGTPSIDDYVRIQQVSAAGLVLTGRYFSTQVIVDYESTVNAYIYIRGQTSQGTTWWGTRVAGTNSPIPENCRLYLETQPIFHGVAASSATFEVWIVYAGASSGNVTISQPRFRSSSTENGY